MQRATVLAAKMVPNVFVSVRSLIQLQRELIKTAVRAAVDVSDPASCSLRT